VPPLFTMDPISAVTTAITLATAIKDVIQLAMEFKNSLDIVPYNIQSLKDDVNHIVQLLGGLHRHASFPGGTTNMGDDTANDIMKLRSGFIDLHKQHLQLLQDFMEPQFRSWFWAPLRFNRARKRLRMWYRRNKTSSEILRLRKLVEQMQMRFLVVGAAKAQQHWEMQEKVNGLLLLETSEGKEASSRRKFIRYISDQVSEISELTTFYSIECDWNRFNMASHTHHS